MRGRERIQEALARLDLHREAQRSRGVARLPPVHRGRGIAEDHRVAGPLQELGVAERDAPGLAGLEGEDPGLDEPLPHELDEGGIQPAPDDLLVDGPGLVGVHHLAAELRIPLEEGIALEHRLARERIEVDPLGEPTAGVPKPLLHLHVGHTVLDPYLHVGAHTLHRGGRSDEGARAVEAVRLDPPLGRKRGGAGEDAEPREPREEEEEAGLADKSRQTDRARETDGARVTDGARKAAVKLSFGDAGHAGQAGHGSLPLVERSRVRNRGRRNAISPPFHLYDAPPA